MGAGVDFEEGQADLEPGDRLFLYTDGITEHFSPAGEAYGESRLVDQLGHARGRPLDDAIQDTLIAMRHFGGSSLPRDDVTLIGIEFV